MRVAPIAAAIVALEAAAIAEPPTPEDLYQEGQDAFDRGDYQVAIEKWRAAYDVSLVPDLLFDVAQARRLSGDCAGALATYRKFLAIDEGSDQRALATDLVRELEPTCGARLPVVVDPPDQVRELNLVDGLSHYKNRNRSLEIAGVATGGAGVLSLGIGLGLGIHARSIGDQVTAACRTSCDWSAWKARDAEGRGDAGIGLALDVVGVAGIVAGAATYYLGWRRGTISVSPRPRDGAVLTWSGSW
jgi:tetratricopeptide (TPR) repeat protein